MSTSVWNPQEHPRESSGMFAKKEQSAPETALARTPWHERPLDALTPQDDLDNPVLNAVRTGFELGDSTEDWEEALRAWSEDGDYEDSDINQELREIIGQPRTLADVEHWTARTQAWVDHARARINTGGADVA